MTSDGISTRIAAAPCGLCRPTRAALSSSLAFKLCAGMLLLALVLLSESVAAGDRTTYLRTASIRSLSAPHRAPVPSAGEARDSERYHRADFGRERASGDARDIADWVVDSADNLGLPFVIVDKVDAKVFVFDAGGRLEGAAPALVGLARGDDTVPGIGDREYADMPPETRTTPAGRFVAELGLDSHGAEVVWVDYDAAVAMHPVVTSNPAERRLERLATPTPLDNRISFGCINVPKNFYETVVHQAFTGTKGIVYVLPETRTAREVFASYDVKERLGRSYVSRAELPSKP